NPPMDKTRISLICRLQNGTPKSTDWSDFVACYGPAVYQICLPRVSQAANAEDVTQKVLLNVFRFINTYDRERHGRFAAWLRRVTANAINDLFRKQRRQTPGSGRTTINELLQNIPAPGGDGEGLPIREDEVDPRDLLRQVLPDWLREAQAQAEA